MSHQYLAMPTDLNCFRIKKGILAKLKTKRDNCTRLSSLRPMDGEAD
jgi:hypothetical protein